MGGVCDTHGNERNEYLVSVRNPEGKRPLGRPIGRWRDDDIKMVVTEVEWRGLDWINLAVDSEH
jgi:hypothetical protein